MRIFIVLFSHTLPEMSCIKTICYTVFGVLAARQGRFAVRSRDGALLPEVVEDKPIFAHEAISAVTATCQALHVLEGV